MVCGCCLNEDSDLPVLALDGVKVGRAMIIAVEKELVPIKMECRDFSHSLTQGSIATVHGDRFIPKWVARQGACQAVSVAWPAFRRPLDLGAAPVVPVPSGLGIDRTGSRASQPGGGQHLPLGDSCARSITQLLRQRQAYYRMLETTQRGELEITRWLHWFLEQTWRTEPSFPTGRALSRRSGPGEGAVGAGESLPPPPHPRWCAGW